jgi:hypothetical protein
LRFDAPEAGRLEIDHHDNGPAQEVIELIVGRNASHQLPLAQRTYIDLQHDELIGIRMPLGRHDPGGAQIKSSKGLKTNLGESGI